MARLLAGLAICLASWILILRRGAGARPLWAVPRIAAGLDAAPVLIGFAAALGATARPLLSGLVIASLAGGLSLAARVQRVVLDEPVVFADRAELLEVVRHPSLYLPFAGAAWGLAGAGAGLATLALFVAWIEPASWTRSTANALVEAVIAIGIAYGCLAIPGRSPALLRRLAQLYTTRLAPSRDPVQDAAAMGPLACLAVHATIAAAERPSRRVAALEQTAPLPPFPAAGPIVLVQAESFFDPARLHPDLGGLLPHFERLAGTAVQRGRLAVPAWGANTVRSEFAVLTGVPEAVLGLDWFNPYEAFAQVDGPALPSLVRAAKAAGYHTVFVHPFDLQFYSRNRVMPLLGFDELVGPEAFAGARRRGDWVADEALGEAVCAVLRRLGPRVFVFAATMEAHGPWGNKPKPGEAVPLPATLQAMPEAIQVGQWLWHLQGTDRMLQLLSEALAGHGGGWLALYGDHQPSLPAAFSAMGLTDRRSDYFLWNSAASNEPAVRDLTAASLAAAFAARMAPA